MQGTLSSLYHAQLIEGPSGPREHVAGKLGVFDYTGAGGGNVCLFAPDDPEALGGRMKLRPSPGMARMESGTLAESEGLAEDGALAESGTLTFTEKETAATYTWRIDGVITDPSVEQAFLEFAEANDRIIRHLLSGARLLKE